jgi:Na+-transporting NADH:ubiquinone oxidoreductase subunit A
MHIPIRRGFNIVVSGAPRQVVGDGAKVTSVALLGADFPEVRPAFSVEVGDRITAGQTLFVDRRRPEIAFTSPAAGVVAAIGRGHRRALDTLVIDLAGDGAEVFSPSPDALSRDGVRELLLKSGLWPAFRTRPFGRIPDPGAVSDSIFVTAMDTNPLAADSAVVLESNAVPFRLGLEVLTLLTAGPVFVCQSPGPALADEGKERIRCVRFDGPHPAGLPGTHIHRLAPVGGGRVVWHIGYQDVIAIGRLLATGRLWTERVIALAGPGVRDPRLVRTRIGASLDDLTEGELSDGDFRIVSGSVLGGREAGFLGRYHTQVSVLPAVREMARLPILSRLIGKGRDVPPPLIPLAAFEQAMALDILPVPLLRALSVGDAETAERLGCLELIEEDMALLSYVCASKTDYGALLRAVLDDLEEGK